MKKKCDECGKGFPDHGPEIPYLKKIEGQVRGIQRMIEERRYCIDIVFQIRSAISALERVENEIFRRHLENCVSDALKNRSKQKIKEKVDEIVKLIKRIKRI